MKMVRVLATLAVALFLTACGGGGGGGEPAVTVVTDPAFLGDVANPNDVDEGMIIPFNGTLDPNSLTAVLWKGTVETGTEVAGEVSLAANGKDVTYLATQRLAFGEPLYTLVLDALDTAGNPVHVEKSFVTTAMVCADNAVWSNPTTFSEVYRNCVADVGVQVKIDQTYNKVQDDTCTVALGAPLSATCRAYLANGTMILANTSIVANSHLVTWMVYVGFDGMSNLILLDTNDPADASPAPVASLVLSSPLSWIIGNVTGAAVHTADGKTSQANLDGANNIVLTCLVGC